MSYRTMTLGQVAPATTAEADLLDDDDQVWLLNLDQVEPHTGRLLSKQFVGFDQAGSSTNWFDESNVLYSKLRPYLNKVYLPDGKGLCTTELVPLKPNPDLITREYLAHYLRSEKFLRWVNEQIDGAKMPRVSMKIFWNHEINLPPLEEQKRIAAILDKADSLRRKRAQAIALADDFLRATFLDMFGDPVTNPKGWPVRRMGDLVEFKGGSQPPKEVFINEPRDDYVRLIQIRDFKSDKYPTYIPEKLAKREFSEDDVMIARYGPPVFQILRGLSGSYNVALMKAIPKIHLTKEFVFWLLQLPAYHDVVVANSERTGGQTGVNLDLLNEMQVPLPSQEVVEELDAKTRKISAFIKKQNLMLEELSAMSAGLAAEYF